VVYLELEWSQIEYEGGSRRPNMLGRSCFEAGNPRIALLAFSFTFYLNLVVSAVVALVVAPGAVSGISVTVVTGKFVNTITLYLISGLAIARIISDRLASCSVDPGSAKPSMPWRSSADDDSRQGISL